MSDEIKKRLNNLKHDPDLKGFEELLELFPNAKKKTTTVRKDKRTNENFALLNLLEIEHQRLEKIRLFFGEKVSKRYDMTQIQTLLKKQRDNKQVAKDKIISKLLDEDSNFNQNFSDFFNQVMS